MNIQEFNTFLSAAVGNFTTHFIEMHRLHPEVWPEEYDSIEAWCDQFIDYLWDKMDGVIADE
jgi:hypothetical protein